MSEKRSPDKNGHYESKKNLENEVYCIEMFCEKFECKVPGMKAQKLHKMDPIDYLIYNHLKTVAFVEIRGLQSVYDAKKAEEGHPVYPHVIFPEAKWKSLVLAGMSFNIPSYLVVRFYDGPVFWIDSATYGSYESYFAKGRPDAEVKRASDNERIIRLKKSRFTALDPPSKPIAIKGNEKNEN